MGAAGRNPRRQISAARLEGHTGLRAFGPSLVDASGTMPYLDLQASADDLLHGCRSFVKSHGAHELSDDAIHTLLAWDAREGRPRHSPPSARSAAS